MKNWYKSLVVMVVVILSFMLMSLQAFAASKTTEFYNGQMTITDSSGNGTGNASKYTITAKGNLISKAKNTITITNETDTDAEISFTYSVSSANSFTIAGATVSTSGDYSAIVGGGDSIAIALQSNSGFSDTTATLTLTNITYAHMAKSSEITFDFDSSLGIITAGGETISSGSTITIGEEGVNVIATPASGAKFVAWIDENNKIISRDSSYTQNSIGNITLKALFSKNTPYFMVDSTHIFSDLNNAAAKGHNLVLICDGVLPKGDYVIPAGVTLLIPFDNKNTIYTTNPDSVNKDEIGDYTHPVVYRTLTMADGAKITVNGAISVSAMQSSQIGTNGSPVVAYGLIDMKNGSKITVNNGGNLYVWGYIAGSGKVIAKSGATVYEDFQVRDWRGGNATSEIVDNSQRVFPMSQYYVQNVQVPLTLEAGAIENGYMSITVSLVGEQSSLVPFIGPDGMFKINSGYIIKDYDEETDRLVIDINGKIEMSSISISMKLSLIGTKTITSKKYVLPINGNITLNVNSGSEIVISQDMALLPGGVINIYKGAICSLSSGTSAFIYDSDEWGKYHFPHSNKITPVAYAHNRKYTRSDSDVIDAEIYIEGTIDADAGYVYATKSGANIHGSEGGLVTLTTDTNTTVTYYIKSDGEGNVSYHEIPVTAAKMKNADGTYTDPTILGDCCSAYIYSNNKWIPQSINHTNIEVLSAAIDPTCTEPGQTESSHCLTCGETLQETEEVPALGHDFSEEWTTDIEPTCSQEGSKSHHCTRCSEKADITPINMLSHTHGDWISVDDNNHKKECACGDVVTAAHNWNDGVVTTPATHMTVGTMTYICKDCSDTKTEIIQKTTEHSYGTWVKVDGTTHNRICECNDIETDSHKFVDLICSECGCKKIVTNTIYTINNEMLTINTSLILDVPANTQIIIATYDSLGTLLNTSLNTIAMPEEIILPSAGVTMIKLFAWDGFNSMNPISAVEEIVL